MTDSQAIGIAEGFIENPGKTPKEQELNLNAAWQHLIDTGLAWELQGWFGRNAQRLIERGICRPPRSRMNRTDSHAVHVHWEPGNGTRYDVVLVYLEQGFQGTGEGMVLVTASGFPRATAFVVNPAPGILHYSYVMEKSGLEAHDASVVTEIVAAVLGREAAPTKEHWYRERVKTPFADIWEGSPPFGPS